MTTSVKTQQSLHNQLALIGLLADGDRHSQLTLLSQLSLTPTALQQTIGTLREWGLIVIVTTSPSRGYQLATPLQRLNQQAIRRYSNHLGITLIPVTNSTNQYLLDQRNSLNCGDACVAEYQYAGRGRRGNRWVAPFGSGALFSIYWHLPSPPATLVSLSLVLCVIIAEILHHLGVPEVTVKWPNDLFLNGCKLGGILIETSSQSGKQTTLVIGAGINLFTAPSTVPSAMSSPLQQTINQPWTSLQAAGSNIDGNQLIGTILQGWRAALQQFTQQGAEHFLANWSLPERVSGQMVRLR